MLAQLVIVLGWLALTFAAAAIASFAQPGEWYAALAKPDWTPPNWLFPPVWAVLYLLMGLAAALVWFRASRPGVRPALAFFVGQLALNALWSWLFFGWHLPGWALVEILLLLGAIVATLALFWRVRPLAGALLVPYAAWVAFATVLNGAIWQLNRV